MESTRIYKVLKSISIPKLNRFIKFIQSPYHNVNASIERLAVYISKSIKEKTDMDDKKTIWNSLAHKKEYSDLRFRKLCNDLLERFEKFLIIENLNENQILQSNLLLNSIRKNKFEMLAEKHITKSSKGIEREIDQSAEYYLQKYFYEKTIQSLKSNYEKNLDIKKGKRIIYSELIKNLDAFYLVEKLRIEIDINTYKKQFKTYELIDTGLPIKDFLSYQFDNHPAVDIYRSMLKLFDESENTAEFYVLRDKAFNNINSFPKDEQREIFDVLVSYCIKWVNKGDLNFVTETLNLYDWGIEEDILLSKGKLSPTTFRNYVVAGLRISEFDKVETFIKTNIKLLNEERKVNALNFNLARVSFYRKNYDEVLDYLNKVNYEDIWYNVNSKVLLFATYYELDEIDVLMTSSESFKTFLRREKDVQNVRMNRYLTFVKYLTKLVNNKHRKDKIAKIKDQLDSDKAVVNKQWLLEKIAEIL
jgi:hypothetical protein